MAITTQYEIRTYDLRPGTLAEAERRLATSRATAADAPLGAFRTEFGPLNQIVELRALGEVDPARGGDPVADLAIAIHAERFAPLPFSPPLAAGDCGPYYEMRIYTYAEPDDVERLAAAWRAALPARLALGPLTAAWRSEPVAGGRFVHLWPYRSLDERVRLRREIRARGEWPPGEVAARLGLPPYRLTRQESKLLTPTSYSRLR